MNKIFLKKYDQHISAPDKKSKNINIVSSELIIIFKIISEVISGKNLAEVFNQYIVNQNINISRVKDVTYGVMRNYFILNAILKSLIKSEPQNEIKFLLLIAFYEIKFTKKPAYAITNDIVDLSFKLIKNIKIKNFTNAIIRSFLRTQNEIERKLTENSEYKYNFPKWIINKLKKDYTNNWQNIIACSNTKPKISLRLNPNKIKLIEYIKYLDTENIDYKLIPLIKSITFKDKTNIATEGLDKVIVIDNISVEKIPFFKEGYVSIQDINAQNLKNIINIKDNQYILDACSAPGGKACQILENNQVNLLAMDIDKNRLEKVQQNLNRLNLKADILCADAGKLDWWDNQHFDIIIADVPCSASGTLKRNPDIKFHRQPSDINNFVTTQRSIILNLWKTLKSKGYMVYITCSIFKEENQENIAFFKQNLEKVIIVNEIQLLPDNDSDGFYYCVLQKKE
ncbi:MAG: hypothetical protein K0R94_153 [Burkholderiales bacterium]|nr:hypothetical protein [Burkholderiales bacterium]